MIRKTAPRKYLETISVLIEDTSTLSPNYFRIVHVPTVLEAGKNLLQLIGSNKLLTNSKIDIEVLDNNKQPIYTEVYRDNEPNGTVSVGIWIYPETAPGECTITLVGTAVVDVNGNALSTSKQNLRWNTTATIAPNRLNTADILFAEPPTVSITQITNPVYKKEYTGSRFFTATGSAVLTYTNYNNSPVLYYNLASINDLITGGTIYISASAFTDLQPPAPYDVTHPAVFSASIEKVLTTKSVRLSIPYTAYSPQFDTPYIYRSGTISGSVTFQYEQLPTLVPVTQSNLVGGAIITSSYALLKVENMSTIGGNIDRIQVYIKNTDSAGVLRTFNNYTTPGNYIKVADTVVQSRELLTNDTAVIDTPIGKFNTNISTITGSWDIATSIGFLPTPPTLSYEANSIVKPRVGAVGNLVNSLSISASNAPQSFTDNQYYIIKTKESYEFDSDTVYTIQFDATAQYDTNFNASANFQLMTVVLSGSAGTDTYPYLDLSNTKYIGTLKNTQGYLFENASFDFTVPKTGTAQVMFLLRAGKWCIRDVSVKPKQELGFSPNTLELIFPIEDYIGSTYDVKVEYCDYLGNISKTVSEVKNFTFTPTPLRVGQLYAENIIIDSIYARHVVVSGSLTASGTNTLIGSTALTGSLSISGSTTQIGNNTLIGTTTLTGSILINGDIIPQLSSSFDLGSVTNPWRSLYVQSGSISIRSDIPGGPDAVISNANGNVSIAAAGFQIKSGSLTPFEVSSTARVQIKVPQIPAGDVGGLSIIGSSDGSYQSVTNAGGLLHLTSNDGQSSRITSDAFGTNANAAYVGRKARGTASSPLPVGSGDVLTRISSIGWTGTDYGFTMSSSITTAPTSIDVVALENYTTSSFGSRFNFYNVPTGSTIRTLSAQIDTTGITIPSSSRFFGTSSWAANALTSSYVSPLIQDVIITGSLKVSGSLTEIGPTVLSGSLTLSSGSALRINNGFYVDGQKQFNYGQFSSTQTQSGSADTAYSMTFDTTDFSNGVSLVAGSRITVANTGLYNIQFSSQLHTTVNQAVDFSIWFAMTGSNIANSNTDFTIEKITGGGFAVAALNFLTQITSGSYVELKYSKTTDQGQLQAKGTQATPTRPATPSAIITVTQIA
jgi:hypothetical protein